MSLDPSNASSSSGSNGPPSICSGCKKEKPDLRVCSACKEGSEYCEACFPKIPQHKPAHALYNTHINVSKDSFKKVTDSFDHKFNDTQLLIDFRVNNFIRLGIHDARIKPGQKFVQLACDDYFFTKEDEKERYLSIVSFIGGSGCGKSSLSRTLCSLNQDKNKPIPGDPRSSKSTSSDINAYKATLNSGNNENFALIDSEGTGGTPLLDDIKNEITNQAAFDIWEEKKRKCVDTAYPRLLYLFSDLVVFVFRGSLKERATIINPLTEYAKIAAANSVNINFRPFLILVYNMVMQDDADGRWDHHDINWIDEDFAKTLGTYYKDPKVVMIPKWLLNKHLCARQIEKLNKMICARVEEAHKIKKDNELLMSKEKMLASLSKVSNLMSKNPGEVINFTELSIRETSVDFLERIAKFFLTIYRELLNKNNPPDSFEKALKLTAERTVYCFLDYLEERDVVHKTLLVKGKVNSEAEKKIEELSKLIVSNLPCIATHKFETKDQGVITVTCETVKGKHTDGHASSKTYHPKDEPDFDPRTALFPDVDAGTPCWWSGEHEAPKGDYDKASIFKIFYEQIVKESNEGLKLRVSEELKRLPNLERTNYCLLCLTEKPLNIFSGCKHSFCENCCETISSEKVTTVTNTITHAPSSSDLSSPQNLKRRKYITCPYCEKESLWEHKPTIDLIGVELDSSQRIERDDAAKLVEQYKDILSRWEKEYNKKNGLQQQDIQSQAGSSTSTSHQSVSNSNTSVESENKDEEESGKGKEKASENGAKVEKDANTEELKCDWCDEGEEKPAVSNCSEHDMNFCQDHLNGHNEDFPDHIELLKKLNVDSKSELEGMLQQDKLNKFIWFDKIKSKLQLGERYFFIQKEPTFKSQTLICSLIGPTGSGKSFYGQQICNPLYGKPVPGKPTNINFSTSSDINAYYGQILKELDISESSTSKKTSDVLDFLLLDIEGTNGTPKTVMDGDVEYSQSVLAKKKEIVGVSYPRLSYLFGDLVCFITTQTTRQKGDIVEELLSYSEFAAANSTLDRNPELLIIFSKVPLDAVKKSDETAEWFKSDRAKELFTYFEDPTIVHIPDKESHEVYEQQIKEMKDLIYKKLEKRKKEKLSFLQKDILLELKKAVKKFSKNPKTECALSLFSVPHKKERVRILTELLQRGDKTEFYEKVYRDTISIIEKRLVGSWVLEQQISSPGNKVEDSASSKKKMSNRVQEFLSEIKVLIENNTPCQASKQFPIGPYGKLSPVYCELSRQSHHQKIHKSSKTYRSSDPLTEIEKEIFGWKEQPERACWWAGEFKGPNIQLNEDTCLQGAQEFLEIPPSEWPEQLKKKFSQFHHDNIQSQSKILSEIFLESGCLCCFSDFRDDDNNNNSYLRICGHSLCKGCLASSKTDWCYYCDSIFSSVELKNLGISPLHELVWKGDIDTITSRKSELEVDLNTVSKSGITPLWLSIYKNRLDIAKELLSHPKIDVNIAPLLDGQTALHIINDLEVAELLIKRGANINALDKSENTPLHAALRKGKFDIVEILLTNKNLHQNSIISPNKKGFTPLHFAARSNRVDLIKKLLDKGAFIDSVTKSGSTPLFFASRSGSFETVIELLQHNANVDHTEREDETTPLYIASQNGYYLIVKALLLKGADPHSTDKNGYTAIHVAAKNDHIKVLNEFYQRNIDLQVKTKKGFTPLMLAATNRNDPKISSAKSFLHIFA